MKIEHLVFFVEDVGPPVLQHVDGMQKNIAKMKAPVRF